MSKQINLGRIIGPPGEQGPPVPSMNIPLETGFFRLEVRSGRLFLIAPNTTTNSPLQIRNGRLILTI